MGTQTKALITNKYIILLLNCDSYISMDEQS